MFNMKTEKTANLSIKEIIEPNWTVCYETRLHDRTFIRSWALYQSSQVSLDGLANIHAAVTLKFIFWQEINQDVLGRGGGKVRLISELFCWPDYRPLRFTTRWEQMYSVIDFDGERFYATLYDGTHIEDLCANAEFLLAENMVPQLAIKLCLISRTGAQDYNTVFFSPNSLQEVPYTLKRTGNEWRSSFDEVISLDPDGWITEIELPEREFSVQRVSRPLPRWRIGSTTLSTKRASTLKYKQPPEDVAHIIDFTLPERSDLRATLAMPANNIKAHAVVLFIPGSGSHDRHGFADGIDLGYHELLDRLASGGITSLRYEKQTLSSTESGENYLEPSYDDIVKDARMVFNYFLERPETYNLPIFFIGHSQGGLVALELAISENKVDGLILMATAGRPIDEVLEDQLVAYARELSMSPDSQSYLLEQHQEFFQAVRKIEEWTQKTVPPRIYAERRLKLYYRQLLARNPLQLASNLHCPVLILQGDHDQQVSVKDAELLYEAARNAGVPCELIIFPNLDHLFKRTSGKPSIAAYFDRRRHVSASVISIIKCWILKVAALSHSGR